MVSGGLRLPNEKEPVKIRDSTRCCESTKTDIELLPLV